ncbi:MAG: TlpA family protein disulfide reductase [Proteobacteria bacterium]|nr:TlpA family protein disulfide reductase [Pseudomonadota bacterium]
MLLTDHTPDKQQTRIAYCHPALRIAALILLLLGLGVEQGIADETSIQHNLVLPSGEEIPFEVFGQGNRLRVLWIAPNFGIRPRHRHVAEALGQRGMEVWQVDLPEALFQPANSDTLRQIPPGMVADIITALSDHGRHPVLVISSIYGAIPALRGIHAWQTRYPKPGVLIGAIFFTPYFFTHVPALGATPTFIPELYATNIPIYIFEAEKNGNRWHLPAMQSALQQHAPVYTEIMGGVTSLFYEDDSSAQTLAMLEVIPDKIIRATGILRQHKTPLTAISLPEAIAIPDTTQTQLDSRLQPYRGNIHPQPILLQDARGHRFELKNFRNRITLINFWASWCPPCVDEIPSLNRLKKKMAGKPFDLISVNYAESPEHIRTFMKKVAVDFPVLVDPNGQLTGKWNVVAFPSTFVIGPDGRIHYGVNAAIHWDTPEVIEQLEQLLTGK